MEITNWLGKPNLKNKSLFGPKSININTLKISGFNVPDGFAVSTQVFNDIIETTSNKKKLEYWLSDNYSIQEKILESVLKNSIKNY